MSKRINEVIKNETNKIVDVYFNNNLFKINTTTKRYVDIPIKYYLNSIKEEHLEYHTGCYNYLFSKDGYSKLTSYVSLKDSSFKLSENETNYNGYVLFNHKIKDQIDIGLCISYVNENVVVQPFYYYMGGEASKVFYLDQTILSTFEKDNESFIGINDFNISLESSKNGWKFSIQVIETNQIYEKDIFIKENMHDNLLGRFLVGVSLVPIQDDLFDPLSGAHFKDIKINKVLLDDNTYLYPGSTSMLKGYSQGYPFANVEVNGHAFILHTIYE